MNSKTKSTVDSQPQRSEQQEWREADGLIYNGDTFVGRVFTSGEAKKLCNAINAALAAAYEKGYAKAYDELKDQIDGG
jgi:hypothetical protein